MPSVASGTISSARARIAPKPAATARSATVVVDPDVELLGDASHLAFEIAQQVGVVDENDVRFLADLPVRGEMMHGCRQAEPPRVAFERIVDPTPEAGEEIGRTGSHPR